MCVSSPSHPLHLLLPTTFPYWFRFCIHVCPSGGNTSLRERSRLKYCVSFPDPHALCRNHLRPFLFLVFVPLFCWSLLKIHKPPLHDRSYALPPPSIDLCKNSTKPALDWFLYFVCVWNKSKKGNLTCFFSSVWTFLFLFLFPPFWLCCHSTLASLTDYFIRIRFFFLSGSTKTFRNLSVEYLAEAMFWKRSARDWWFATKPENALATYCQIIANIYIIFLFENIVVDSLEQRNAWKQNDKGKEMQNPSLIMVLVKLYRLIHEISINKGESHQNLVNCFGKKWTCHQSNSITLKWNRSR